MSRSCSPDLHRLKEEASHEDESFREQARWEVELRQRKQMTVLFLAVVTVVAVLWAAYPPSEGWTASRCGEAGSAHCVEEAAAPCMPTPRPQSQRPPPPPAAAAPAAHGERVSALSAALCGRCRLPPCECKGLLALCMNAL
jgi:hypothetical protein